jgi:hypothetical protein
MENQQKLYELFDNSPEPTKKSEFPETNSGLISRGCPSCGKMETRETYVRGFWAEVHELKTDYACDILYKCKCGQYVADTVWEVKMNSNEFYQMMENYSSDLHSGCSSQKEFKGSVPGMADNILSEPEVKEFLIKKLEITDEIEQKEFIEGLL